MEKNKNENTSEKVKIKEVISWLKTNRRKWDAFQEYSLKVMNSEEWLSTNMKYIDIIMIE